MSFDSFVFFQNVQKVLQNRFPKSKSLLQHSPSLFSVCTLAVTSWVPSTSASPYCFVSLKCAGFHNQSPSTNYAGRVHNIGLTGRVHNIGLTGRVHNIGLTRRVHNIGLTRRVQNIGLTGRVHNIGPTGRVHNMGLTRRVHNIGLTGRVHNIGLWKGS